MKITNFRGDLNDILAKKYYCWWQQVAIDVSHTRFSNPDQTVAEQVDDLSRNVRSAVNMFDRWQVTQPPEISQNDRIIQLVESHLYIARHTSNTVQLVKSLSLLRPSHLQNRIWQYRQHWFCFQNRITYFWDATILYFSKKETKLIFRVISSIHRLNKNTDR